MMAIHWTLKILLIFHPRSNSMYHYIAKNFANHIVSKNQSWIKNPVKSQTKTLETLIDSGRKTFFGDQHFFKDIRKYEEFKEWKIHGYVLPSSVFGVVRTECPKTGKVEEYLED